jgi:hypothetical protein
MNKETALKEWEKQRKFARETWESKYGPKMPWGTPLHGEWAGWEQGIIAGANWQKEQSATDAIEFLEWAHTNVTAGRQHADTVIWRLDIEKHDSNNLTTQQLYELWKQTKE